MSLASIWATVLATIQVVGYLKLGLMVVVDIILWKIHPVLGVIGALLIFAFLMQWI